MYTLCQTLIMKTDSRLYSALVWKDYCGCNKAQFNYCSILNVQTTAADPIQQLLAPTVVSVDTEAAVCSRLVQCGVVALMQVSLQRLRWSGGLCRFSAPRGCSVTTSFPLLMSQRLCRPSFSPTASALFCIEMITSISRFYGLWSNHKWAFTSLIKASDLREFSLILKQNVYLDT